MDTPEREGRPIFTFDNSYARLPERFFQKLSPTPVSGPQLIHVNADLAEELGIDAAQLALPASVAMLAGNRVPLGSEPIAQAYAGHQFGHFSPRLGDGRAHLLGEVIDRHGDRRDIQLKGSGPTRFSRRGDGRAALGPMLRELVIGEALSALGIPTTRVLAVVATGEVVMRERMLPGAVLTRVAASHVRVGTFQYFASQQDIDAVRLLANYSMERHYSNALEAERPYLSFLEQVIARQAELIARWLLVGFIHGVMNTDNMAISGESIDFGPCAFVDTYDPATVFSSVDHAGRYAFGNQPAIAQWNLTRLAECLLPLLDDDHATAVALAKGALESFAPRFERVHLSGLRGKTGLMTNREGDEGLLGDLLGLMIEAKADYTSTFRALVKAQLAGSDGNELKSTLAGSSRTVDWFERWRKRLAEEPEADRVMRQETMREANPIYIPRNHLVEEALSAAEQDGDLKPVNRLLEILRRPFDEQSDADRYALPPKPHEVVHMTFCGT